MSLIEKYLVESSIKIIGNKINMRFDKKKKPFKSDVIDLFNKEIPGKWEIKKDGIFVFDDISTAKKAYKLVTNL